MGEPAQRLRIAEATAPAARRDLEWTLERVLWESDEKLLAKCVLTEIRRRAGRRPVAISFTLESIVAVVGGSVEAVRRVLLHLDGLVLDILDRPGPGRSIGPALWCARPCDLDAIPVHRVLRPAAWRWLPGVEWEDPWSARTPLPEELAGNNSSAGGVLCNNSSARGASSSNRGIDGGICTDLHSPGATCIGGHHKEEEKISSSSLEDRLAELKRRLWAKGERTEPGERDFLYGLAVLLGDPAHNHWLNRLVDKIEERKPASPAGYGMIAAKDFAPAGCNTWQLFNRVHVPDEFRTVEVPDPPPAVREGSPEWYDAMRRAAQANPLSMREVMRAARARNPEP